MSTRPQIFEEFWHFTTRENGAILVVPCHCSTASVCGNFARHSTAFSGFLTQMTSFIRHLFNRYTRHETIMDTSIVKEYLYKVILDKVNWYFMLITNWITPQIRMLFRNWILSDDKSGNGNYDEF